MSSKFFWVPFKHSDVARFQVDNELKTWRLNLHFTQSSDFRKHRESFYIYSIVIHDFACKARQKNFNSTSTQTQKRKRKEINGRAWRGSEMFSSSRGAFWIIITLFEYIRELTPLPHLLAHHWKKDTRWNVFCVMPHIEMNWSGKCKH